MLSDSTEIQEKTPTASWLVPACEWSLIKAKKHGGLAHWTTDAHIKTQPLFLFDGYVYQIFR